MLTMSFTHSHNVCQKPSITILPIEEPCVIKAFLIIEANKININNKYNIISFCNKAPALSPQPFFLGTEKSLILHCKILWPFR